MCSVNLLQPDPMGSVSLLQLDPMGDDRGSLIALETSKNVPFNIKRVYYIYDTRTDIARGFHAHQHLQQLVICLKGACRFITDDGSEKQEHWLDSPEQGLFLSGLLWREMHDFSADCVLLILTDQLYDPNDYVRDYEQFLSMAKQRNA
ncbi:sugar 3,4-ketoisomerase [Methylophaga sp. OBS4]|uniref:sugar 3,4-ketoisomerase n=1 Tax=Methylophaga sp. OBS4 TaxID=2991935 RepID=UPI0022518C26|nr:FdtA/QdtA family cupin domain-containing protein [Methylophaga sp. OBS4]MCX4187365.1 FdtA/QdtA family cupin domain-containing protein [Methylophaga sp. OBS4]